MTSILGQKQYSVTDLYRAMVRELTNNLTAVGSSKERISALVQQLERAQKLNVPDEAKETLASVQGKSYIAAKMLVQADQAIADALSMLQYDLGASAHKE